jgi:hypothetical protein
MQYFLIIYIITAIILDYFYSKKYTWNQNCTLERVATSSIQPIMEIIGNGMTAHNWTFKNILIKKQIPEGCKLCYEVSQNPFAKLHSKRIKRILTSAVVDINPFQPAAIIRPKNYEGKWKICFEIDKNQGLYQIAKYSHTGKVKILIDGSGYIMGMDSSGEFLELEIVEYCKAWQRRDVFLV